MKMPTGAFYMAPLSEFTVTSVDYTKGEKRKVSWDDWHRMNNFPDYELQGNQVIFDSLKEPEDIEIIMPENDPPFELVWVK
jgi:hypothetical protein